MSIKYIGYDKAGIPRVWAEDDFHQTAHAFCREEIVKYVCRRPDTGPASDWLIEEDEAVSYVPRL